MRRPPEKSAGPVVVNCFAQWEMGGPGKYRRVAPPDPAQKDSAAEREGWFQACLGHVAKITPPLRSVAFPYEIGCGLAGGKWPAYERMIADFARGNPDVEVTIAKWGGGPAKGGKGKGKGKG